MYICVFVTVCPYLCVHVHACVKNNAVQLHVCLVFYSVCVCVCMRGCGHMYVVVCVCGV